MLPPDDISEDIKLEGPWNDCHTGGFMGPTWKASGPWFGCQLWAKGYSGLLLLVYWALQVCAFQKAAEKVGAQGQTIGSLALLCYPAIPAKGNCMLLIPEPLQLDIHCRKY